MQGNYIPKHLLLKKTDLLDLLDRVAKYKCSGTFLCFCKLLDRHKPRQKILRMP